MPWKSFKNGEEFCVFKLDDAGKKTGDTLGCHPSKEAADKQVSALYANDEEMPMEDRARGLFENFWRGLKSLFTERKVKEVDSWDGAASAYGSTEEYCDACLIDVNAAAGRDTKAQSHCMLPVKMPGDSMMADKGIMAAAGGHGISQVKKPDDVPQGDWDKAVKAAAGKIVAAYKEMDEEPPEAMMEMARGVERAVSTGDLFERIWGKLMERMEYDGEWVYPLDIYHDNGQMYLIATSGGRLYRYGVTMTGDEPALGEPVEVAVQHNPVTTRTLIRRQADGRYRWVSRSATSTLNRVGEIDSRALFASFAAHVEATGEYPIRQFYHQGEQFRTGLADFVAVDGNVLITSGIYDDTLLGQMERAAIEKEPAYWGESIGYKPTESPALVEVARDIRIPVYSAGILREISTLPEEQAANLFTTIHPMEVNRMLKGQVREAFVKLFADDEAAAEAWLAENVDELNRAIQETGLITREAAAAPAAEPPLPAIGQAVFELDDAAIAAIVARLAEGDTAAPVIARALESETILTLRQNVTELAAQVGDLQSRLAALEADEDAKKRQWQEDMPANGKVKVTYRPREVHQPVGDGGQTMSQRAATVRPKNAY